MSEIIGGGGPVQGSLVPPPPMDHEHDWEELRIVGETEPEARYCWLCGLIEAP